MSVTREAVEAAKARVRDTAQNLYDCPLFDATAHYQQSDSTSRKRAFAHDVLAILTALQAREGEIQRLNRRNVEVSVLAQGWMAQHDKLLGFVQERPSLLSELIADDPRGSPPSPADVPALQSALAEALGALEPFAAHSEKLHSGFDDGIAAGFTPTVPTFVSHLRKAAEVHSRLTNGEGGGA